MLWWKHLGSSLTLGNKMFSWKDFGWITYVISSRNVCLYRKEGSVRKKRCDPVGNIQVYRVIAAPRVYTAKHVENGHFRISWEFKVTFWVSLSSFSFSGTFTWTWPRLQETSERRLLQVSNQRRVQGTWSTPTITFKCEGGLGTQRSEAAQQWLFCREIKNCRVNLIFFHV